MNVTMVVLRLLHLFAGVFWAGSVFIVAGFLLPAVRTTGPAAGPLMRQLMDVRKLPMRIGAAAMLTVLSGLLLYWRDVSMSAGAFAQSRQGMVFGLGGASALLALIPGIGIVARTGTKLSALGATIAGQGGPPTPDQLATMGALQARMLKGAHATAGFVGIALFAMAVARYV